LLAISFAVSIACSVVFQAIHLSNARLQRLHTSPSHVSFNVLTIFFASLAFNNHCTANHSAFCHAAFCNHGIIFFTHLATHGSDHLID